MDTGGDIGVAFPWIFDIRVAARLDGVALGMAR